ncbi:MAG: serine/threonine protein phosphatase [Lachnospiraceae bacterium]|nr:serine/threonine protein phosphatase [Lachnospiraceae bacterium]
MAVYVMGDVHGEYEKFADLLSQIGLQDDDTLYVMGDVLDRGPHPVKVLLKLMEMPNAFCLLGNHELMALECLPFLMQEITDDSIGAVTADRLKALASWMQNGCQTTLEEFRALDRETQEEVLDYLRDLLLYAEVEAGGGKYFLVHAGLGNFAPEKPIEAYSLYDLVWQRADYGRRYFADKTLVTGHTPTQNIDENPAPGCIYRGKGHLALDCGAGFEGGRLAAVCLGTGQEFYA